MSIKTHAIIIFTRILLVFVFISLFDSSVFCDSSGILSKSDFSRGKSGWNIFLQLGGQAAFSVDNGEAYIHISNTGEVVHAVTFYRRGIKIEKGITYTVSFKARTATGRKIIYVKVGLGKEPWTLYSGYEEFKINTVKKEYSFDFTMTEKTDRDALFDFLLAADNNDVYLDDIILKRKFSTPAHALVKFTASGDPFRTSGYGILLSMSADWPEDKYIENLKPSLIRYGNFSVYKRAKKWNARFMLLLYGEYPGIYINGRLDKNGNWPGDNDNWEEWDEYVTKIVKQALRQGYDDVIWEVWNEPDIDIFWKRSFNQFLQTYEHTVKTIRRFIPKALITGPGFALYDERKINEFLKYAKDHDVLPDIINWHEIPDAPDGIPGRAEKLKAYLKKNNITIDRLMFPEISHPDFQFSPGNAVSFIANIHRTYVEASAKSCWPEVSLSGCVENCFTDTLDGLLHPLTGEPRSIWWCYKKYAEMSGFLLDFFTLDKKTALDGIAAYDASAEKAFILLGRTQSNNVLKKRPKTGRTQDIVVEIENIPAALLQSNDIRVVVKKIPDTGPNVLKQPQLITDSDKQVYDGSLQITLPAMGIEDVYFITLTHPRKKISVYENDYSTDYDNYYLEKVFNNKIYWYIATDRDVGGTSSGEITVKTENINGKQVDTLTMNGTLSGACENPYVVFGISTWVFGKKLQKSKGIRFKVIGAGGTYRIEFVTPRVKDYCYHGRTFQADANNSKVITVYFNQVDQRSWAKKVPFAKHTITAINFIFDRGIMQADKKIRLKLFDFEIVAE